MLDFTCTLYLGLRHGATSLRPWPQLTKGAPAALVETARQRHLARRIAALQGCERGTLGRSTLHLFWDLFGLLAKQPIAIYLDRGSYPVARWGVERAAGQGTPVYGFPHHGPGALWRLLRQGAGKRRPVVVTDGLCTGCGCSTPLAEYLDCVRRVHGLLIVDDTQALGLLGAAPDLANPYGKGGGGSLRHLGLAGPDIILVSSLAKALGAPLAVLAGSHKVIRWYENGSETRMHSSPPSAADISAGERAIRLNVQMGDVLRQSLARRVRHFRDGLAAKKVPVTGGLFPVQTIGPVPGVDQAMLYRHLAESGIRTVLRRTCGGADPRISFILTARTAVDDIDHAILTLAGPLRPRPSGT